MLETEKNIFLFEVSWEVCNKVGGIYTVLRSKLRQVLKSFGDDYILIGPLLKENRHFIEDNSVRCATIKKILTDKNINCKVGYWDTGVKPLVILVDFENRYKLDVLLYNLWADFGIDSLASNYEFYEPILFSTAAAEVIEVLSQADTTKDKTVIAHFHEWLCGAGLLYIKKHCEKIPTVFTTHSTVLGRALSNNNKSIYNLPQSFIPNVEVKKYGVSTSAKHLLEVASAKHATCFTTVSEVTAKECYVILGRYPDKILMNGLDIERKRNIVSESIIGATRAKLREIAAKVIGTNLPENTLLMITSGRYEFHNKGFDVLINSLAQLETKLTKESPPIVVFFFIAENIRTKEDSLLNGNATLLNEQKNAIGIAVNQIKNVNTDSIIKACIDNNFKQTDRKIHIVYSDAYLNGTDGVFDIIYEQVLASCDISIFPSYYEPWGYTPLESIAYGVPTLTTDLAGFGLWICSLKKECMYAINMLPRKGINDIDFTNSLTNYLLDFVEKTSDHAFIAAIHATAFEIAKFADWEHMYGEYLEAYDEALKLDIAVFRAKVEATQSLTTIYDAETTLPRFRLIQFECPLPEKLNKLRELAYNFWWAWNENGRLLFKKISPDLWEKSLHNPVQFLNTISTSLLNRSANSVEYMKFYNEVLASFSSYAKNQSELIKFCSPETISAKSPIAYFCMEYGIDECLPIYSGGLGILAGDYLKEMSDLSIPMVAVGLFYKQGYFIQNINSAGNQVPSYQNWNTSQIPMRQVNDEAGKTILVGIEILGRTVYARAWEVKIGHVNVYLLDTDVSENLPEDRIITNSLYGGTKEIRLKQELILGIGGSRLITEKLNLTPVLYHLNEGHSAFLLLERIKNYFRQGFSWREAAEFVRCSSVFTTHTPVPAGNETFAEELIKKYFASYLETLNFSIQSLLNIARDIDPISKLPIFSMTALALRLTLNSNAVSNLHGKVARGMWQNLWPGLLENEVPINHVTNGVHLATWLGPEMTALFDDYLVADWRTKQDDPEVWKKIDFISDKELWTAKQSQKVRLIDAVKKMIIEEYSLRNENKQLINNSVNSLKSDALIIGIARRFTPYKRNDLILKDKERLANILTNPNRPVVMLIAGKAHPADSGGNELIREIIETLREKIFAGHIIFLEEYNFALAKLLVQGVDVWLNTPILGREACGTSGMKAGINGGLNFSTRDGWWDEAFEPGIGWEIESMVKIDNLDKRNDIENLLLLDSLENEVVSLYYDQKRGGASQLWLNKIKNSISLIACQFNTQRMAHDYISKMYCPTILEVDELAKNEYAKLKQYTTWKQDIVERFNTVKIKTIIVNGVKEGKILAPGLIKIEALIFSGKLIASELRVELVLVKSDGKQFIETPFTIALELADSAETGILTYFGEYTIEDTGFYSYGIRVFPYNDMLLRKYDAGIVYWG